MSESETEPQASTSSVDENNDGEPSGGHQDAAGTATTSETDGTANATSSPDAEVPGSGAESAPQEAQAPPGPPPVRVMRLAGGPVDFELLISQPYEDYNHDSRFFLAPGAQTLSKYEAMPASGVTGGTSKNGTAGMAAVSGITRPPAPVVASVPTEDDDELADELAADGPDVDAVREKEALAMKAAETQKRLANAEGDDLLALRADLVREAAGDEHGGAEKAGEGVVAGAAKAASPVVLGAAERDAAASKEGKAQAAGLLATAKQGGQPSFAFVAYPGSFPAAKKNDDTQVKRKAEDAKFVGCASSKARQGRWINNTATQYVTREGPPPPLHPPPPAEQMGDNATPPPAGATADEAAAGGETSAPLSGETTSTAATEGADAHAPASADTSGSGATAGAASTSGTSSALEISTTTTTSFEATSETAAGGSGAAPVVPGSEEEADISAVEDNLPDGLTASDGAPAAPGAKEEETRGAVEATESTTTNKPGACIADPTDVAGRFDPLGAADYCERPEHQEADGISCPLESPSPTLLPNCKWVDVDAGKAMQLQKMPFDRGSCKVNIERHLKLVQELMNENAICRAIDDPLRACVSPCWYAGTDQCSSVTVLQKRDCSRRKTEEKCARVPHCAWLSGGGKKEKNETDSVPSEAAENETAGAHRLEDGRCVLRVEKHWEDPRSCRTHSAKECQEAEDEHCVWEEYTDGNSSASDAIAKERVKPASFRSGLEEMGLIDQDADLDDPPTLVRFSECDVPGAAQPDHEAAKTHTSVALPAATDAAAGAVDDIAAGVGGGASAAGGENDNEKVALGGAPSADEIDPATQKSAGTMSLLEIPSGTSTSFQDTGSLDPGEEAKQRAEAAIEQENEEEPGEEQSLTANENEKADDQHDPASSSTTVNSDADANSADSTSKSALGFFKFMNPKPEEPSTSSKKRTYWVVESRMRNQLQIPKKRETPPDPALGESLKTQEPLEPSGAQGNTVVGAPTEGGVAQQPSPGAATVVGSTTTENPSPATETGFQQITIEAGGPQPQAPDVGGLQPPPGVGAAGILPPAGTATANAESKPTLVHQPRANDLKTTDVPVPLRAQASQYKRVKAEFEETVRARFKPHESPYPDTIRLLPRKSPHLPVGTHDPALLSLLANTLGKKPAYVPGRCISTTGEVVHISGGGGGGGGAEDPCGKNRTSAACGVDPGNCVWTIALPPPPVAWNPTGHCRAKAPIDDNEDIQDVCAGKEEKNCGEECEWVVEEETESGKKGKTEDGDEAEDITGEDEKQDRPEDTAGTGLGFAAASSTRRTRRSAAELRRAKKNGGTCRFQPDLDREECVQKSSSKSDCLQDAKCAYLKLPPQVLEPAYCASKFHAKGVKNECDDYAEQESCDQHWSSCDWRAAVYDTTTTEYGVCKGDADAKILCSGHGLNDVDYNRCTALPQCQWHHGSGCADGTEKTTSCGHCEENKTLNYKCSLITEQERCGGEESLLHLDHEGKPTVEEKKLSQVCRWDLNEEKHQPDKWHCVPKGDVARKTCLAHAEQADCESAPKSEQCQWVHLHGGCTYLQHSRDRKLCENTPETLAKELPTSPDKYCCDNDATAPAGNIENASATTGGDTTSTSTNISMQPSRKHLERPPYLVQEKACLTSWTPSDEDEGNGRQPPRDDSAKRDPVTGDALCRFTDEKAAVQHAFCRPNRDNGILTETQENMLEDLCGKNEDRKACLRYSSCEWEDPRPHVCKYKPDVASDECSDVNYAYEQYAEEKCRENENCRWDVAKQMCRLDYEANRETCANVNEGILAAVEDNSAGAATTSEEQTDTTSSMSSTMSSVQENCEAAGPSCTWVPFNPSEDERAVMAVLRNRQAQAEEQRKAVNELLFPKKPVQAVAHEVDLQLVQRPSLAAACLRESMFSRRAYFTESTGKHVLAFFPKLSGWEHADNALSLADQMQQDAADAEKDGGAGEGVGGIVVGGGAAAAAGPGVAVGSGDGPEGTNPKEESEKGGDETLAGPAAGAEVGSAAAGEGGENEDKTGDSLAAATATPDGTTRVDHEGGPSNGAGSSSVSGSEGVSSGVVSTGSKRASVVNATGSGPDDAEEVEPAGFPRPKLGTCYTATARVHATGAEVFQKLRQNFREAPDGDSDMLSMFRGRVDFARDQKWRASGTDMLPFLYHEYHVLEILKGVLTALKDLHTVKWGRQELAHLFGGEKFVPKRSLYGMQHRDVATLQNLVYDTKKPGFLSAEPDAAAGADDVQSGLADVKLTGFSLAKVIGTRVDFLRDAYANFVADAHAEAEAEAARVSAPTRITNYFKETKRSMDQAFEEGLEEGFEEDEQENTGEKDPATQADGTAAKDEQTPGPAAEAEESETGTAAGLAGADAVGDGSKSPEPVVAAASKSNGLGGGEQGEHRAPATKFFTSSDYEPPVPTRLLLSAGPETFHDGVASAQEDYHMLANSLLRYACVMKKDFAEQFTYGAAVRELTHPQPKPKGTGKIAALVNAGQRVLNYLREMSPMASTATLPANDALLQGPESLADVVAAGGTGVSGFLETARSRGASHEVGSGSARDTWTVGRTNKKQEVIGRIMMSQFPSHVHGVATAHRHRTKAKNATAAALAGTTAGGGRSSRTHRWQQLRSLGQKSFLGISSLMSPEAPPAPPGAAAQKSYRPPRAHTASSDPSSYLGLSGLTSMAPTLPAVPGAGALPLPAVPGGDMAAQMSQGESGLMKSMATSLAEKAGIPPSQVEALLEKVPSRTSTSDDKASPAGAAAAASAAGAAAEKAGGVIEQGEERDDAASGTTTNIKHWDRLFPLHGQPVDDATQQFSRLPLADLDDETFVYQCPREPADVETTRTPAHPALVNLLASLRRLSHPHTRKARFSVPPSPARVDHCVDDLLARLKQAMDLLRRIESLEEKSQAERWSGRSRLLGNSTLTAEETQFLDTHEREKILRVALQVPPSCRLEENALGPSTIDLPLQQGAFWKKYSDYMKWYTTIVPAPNDAPVWTSTKSGGGFFNTNISSNLNAISGKIGGISGKIGGIFAS